MGSDYLLVTQTGRESAVKLHFLSYLLCLMFWLLWWKRIADSGTATGRHSGPEIFILDVGPLYNTQK